MKGLIAVPALLAAGVILSGCAGSPTEQINGAPEGAAAYSSSAASTAPARSSAHMVSSAGSSAAARTTPADSSVVSGGPSASQEDSANQRSSACNVSRLGSYKGRQGNQGLYREILNKSGARIQRVLTPQSITTLEYRADRVDIRIDGNGRITSLSCG